ncbi:uncharacterized protein LOC106462027 isoform X2 [Limulus polyphemus]|uniref:Uncharacterized protein LOC106462027 isoform X2 n=1 Tax=Limulus polyphemus TaxID=6850 RepID=A0ABM1SMJ8_LIMPO|nr:uncharacterized protein LOC106462027 isoform X2 [Limulus polyphemus]
MALQNYSDMTLLQEMMRGDDGSSTIGPPPVDMILKRVEDLAAKKQEDIALKLCELSKNTNQNMFNTLDSYSGIVSEELEQNVQQQKNQKVFIWQLLLLHRTGRVSELVREIASCSCHQGVQLIHQVRNSSEPDAINLAETLIHVFLVRDLLVPSNYCCTKDLMSLWCSLQVEQNRDVEDVCMAAQMLLVQHASTSAHFYLFVDVLWEEYEQLMLPLYLEFYVRGLTTDLNFLEVVRSEGFADQILELEIHIACMFSKLGTLFERKQDEIAFECILSAFSIDPTWKKLKMLEDIKKRIVTKNTRSQCVDTIVSEEFLEALPRVQDWVVNSNETVNKNCLCGIKCFTPSEESEVMAHICEDGRPQYLYHFPHPILDLHIQGVSYSLLKDFVMVLECMRCYTLNRCNTWEEMQQVCQNYLVTTSTLKTIIQHRHIYENSDSEIDSVSENDFIGNNVETMQQSINPLFPLSTINNRSRSNLHAVYNLPLSMTKRTKKIQKVNKGLRKGSFSKLNTLKESHTKKEKTMIENELKKKRQKKKRRTKKEKDRDGSGEVGLEKIKCKKRRFKKKDKIRGQIIQCLSFLGLAPALNSFEVDLASLVNKCVDVLLSQLNCNVITSMKKKQILTSASSGLVHEQNSNIALLSHLLSSGVIGNSETEKIVQQLLQIEKRRRKRARIQKLKKSRFAERTHKQKPVENKQISFRKVKEKKQGKKIVKKISKNSIKSFTHKNLDSFETPNLSSKPRCLIGINTKCAFTTFTPTPPKQIFAPSDLAKKPLTLSPARRSSRTEDRLPNGKQCEVSYPLNQPVLCKKLRDSYCFRGIAASKDCLSTVTTIVCKTRPSTIPILHSTEKTDSTIVSTSPSCISPSIAPLSTIRVPIIVSNKSMTQKPTSTFTSSPVLNNKTLNQECPSHKLEPQADATILFSVSAAEKLNISHQQLLEISQHVPAVATLTLPGWRDGGGGHNSGARVLTGRVVIPVNNLNNNNDLSKETFCTQNSAIMSSESGNPTTVVIPSVIIVKGAPTNPENKVSTKENLCQNLGYQKDQKRKCIWSPVRNRPVSLEYCKNLGHKKLGVGSSQKTIVASESRMNLSSVPVCIQAVNSDLKATTITSEQSQVVNSLVNVRSNQKIMGLVSTTGVTITSESVYIHAGEGNLPFTTMIAGKSEVLSSVSSTQLVRNPASQRSNLQAEENSQSDSSNQYIVIKSSGNPKSIFVTAVTTTTTCSKILGIKKDTQTLTTMPMVTESDSYQKMSVRISETGVSNLSSTNSTVLVGLPAVAKSVSSGQRKHMNDSKSLSFVTVQTTSVPGKTIKCSTLKKLKPKGESGKHPKLISKPKAHSKKSHIVSGTFTFSERSTGLVKRTLGSHSAKESQFTSTPCSREGSVNIHFSAATVNGIQSEEISVECTTQLKISAALNKPLPTTAGTVQVVLNYSQYMNYEDNGSIPQTSSATFCGSLATHPLPSCVGENTSLLPFLTSASDLDYQRYGIPPYSLSLYPNTSWKPEEEEGDTETKPKKKAHRKKSSSNEKQSSGKQKKEDTSIPSTLSNRKLSEGTKKFWCISCSRSFFSAYNLRRHRKNVHKMDLPSHGSGLETPLSTLESVSLNMPFVSCSQSDIEGEISSNHQGTSILATDQESQNTPCITFPENINCQSSALTDLQPVVTQVPGPFQYTRNEILPSSTSLIGEPGVYPVPVVAVHRGMNSQFGSVMKHSQAHVSTSKSSRSNSISPPVVTVTPSRSFSVDFDPLVTKEYSSLQPLPPGDVDFSGVKEILHSTEKWEHLQPISVSLPSEVGVMLTPPEISVSYGAPQVLKFSDTSVSSMVPQEQSIPNILVENVYNSSNCCVKSGTSSVSSSKPSQGGTCESSNCGVQSMKQVHPELISASSKLLEDTHDTSDRGQDIYLGSQKSFNDCQKNNLSGEKLNKNKIVTSNCHENMDYSENDSFNRYESYDPGPGAIFDRNQNMDNSDVVISSNKKVSNNDIYINSSDQKNIDVSEDAVCEGLQVVNNNQNVDVSEDAVCEGLQVVNNDQNVDVSEDAVCEGLQVVNNNQNVDFSEDAVCEDLQVLNNNQNIDVREEAVCEGLQVVNNSQSIDVSESAVCQGLQVVNNSQNIDVSDDAVCEGLQVVNNSQSMDISDDAVCEDLKVLNNNQNIDVSEDAVCEGLQVLNNSQNIDVSEDAVCEGLQVLNNSQNIDVSEDAVCEGLQVLNNSQKTICGSQQNFDSSSHKRVYENIISISSEISLREKISNEINETCSESKVCSQECAISEMAEQLKTYSPPESVTKTTQTITQGQGCKNEDFVSKLGCAFSPVTSLTRVLQPNIKLSTCVGYETVVDAGYVSTTADGVTKESQSTTCVTLKHESPDTVVDTSLSDLNKSLTEVLLSENNIFKSRNLEVAKDSSSELARKNITEELQMEKSILKIKAEEAILNDTVSNSVQITANETKTKKRLLRQGIRDTSLSDACSSSVPVILAKDLLLERSISRVKSQELNEVTNSNNSTGCLAKDTKFQRSASRRKNLENVHDTDLAKTISDCNQRQEMLLENKSQDISDNNIPFPRHETTIAIDGLKKDSKIFPDGIIINKEDLDASNTNTNGTESSKQSSLENYIVPLTSSSIIENIEKIPESEDMYRPNCQTRRWSIKCLQLSGRSEGSSSSCIEEESQSEDKYNLPEGGIRGRTRSRDISKQSLKRNCTCCENSTRTSSFSKRCRITTSNRGSRTQNQKQMLSKINLRKTRSSVLSSGVRTRSSRSKCRPIVYL